MTPPTVGLTDEECAEIFHEVWSETSVRTLVRVERLMNAAFALGAKRQRERDAEIARGYWCRSGEACGKDIAAAIEGEGKP